MTENESNPRTEGSSGAIGSESDTPETDAFASTPRGLGTGYYQALDHARKLERSLRKSHNAFREKVCGEIHFGHFDKGALTTIAEIQREHPSLAPTPNTEPRDGATETRPETKP